MRLDGLGCGDTQSCGLLVNAPGHRPTAVAMAAHGQDIQEIGCFSGAPSHHRNEAVLRSRQMADRMKLR